MSFSGTWALRESSGKDRRVRYALTRSLLLPVWFVTTLTHRNLNFCRGPLKSIVGLIIETLPTPMIPQVGLLFIPDPSRLQAVQWQLSGPQTPLIPEFLSKRNPLRPLMREPEAQGFLETFSVGYLFRVLLASYN